MKKILVSLSVVCAGVGLAWSLWPSAPAADVSSAVSVALAARRIPTTLSIGTPERRALISPFGIDPAPTPPSDEENNAALRKMEQEVGINLPERYYKLDLKTLKQMSDAGDIYAALQLGMKYLTQNEVLEQDPGYDFDVNPKHEAKKYFENAALMGSVSAITMLYTRLAEQDPVQAYAWKLIAEKTGNELQRDGFRDHQYSFALSNSDIHEAETQSEEILRKMLAHPRPVVPHS